MEGKKVKIIIVSIMIIGISIACTVLFKTNSISEKTIDQEKKIETRIEEYIIKNGKKYSKDIIFGENSFYVGGIGKSIKSYNVDKFKPEDFDIKGLIESVPENCDKFGSIVNINDEEIIVDIYTEKDKFYKKVE